MLVKVWGSFIPNDGISTELKQETSASVTTTLLPMTIPSSMVTIGIVSTQGILTFIQILHNEKQPFKTLRHMQDGAETVFSS